MPVHPHACGEHERHCTVTDLARRFIPTHVGNTSPRHEATRFAPVHPHACGEHAGSGVACTSPNGSSPRMWGTHLVRRHHFGHRRFIPTHVGNTIRFLISARSRTGSSPRMWGTPCAIDDVPVLDRFIPTHVGNTVPDWVPEPTTAVHPHACGEHINWVGGGHACSGSSPRMWGTRLIHVSVLPCARFIPTHVGNTKPFPETQSPQPVHPHACGEHVEWVRPALLKIGSSPRMWGTHFRYLIERQRNFDLSIFYRKIEAMRVVKEAALNPPQRASGKKLTS